MTHWSPGNFLGGSGFASHGLPSDHPWPSSSFSSGGKYPERPGECWVVLEWAMGPTRMAFVFHEKLWETWINMMQSIDTYWYWKSGCLTERHVVFLPLPFSTPLESRGFDRFHHRSQLYNQYERSTILPRLSRNAKTFRGSVEWHPFTFLGNNGYHSSARHFNALPKFSLVFENC